MPALFTTTSTRPKASSAVCTIRFAPAQVETLSVFAAAAPPRLRISPTTRSAGPWSAPSPVSEAPISLTTTFAPAAPSASAISRPMPPPAPVTIATLPSSIWNLRCRSHQDDVELLLRVARLDLHRYRLADEVAEHRERLRLLLEEEVDHALRGEDAVLARVELPRLAQDLAQDLVAHRARGLEHAAPGAGRARLAQHVLERLARALARHLDQAELREPVQRHLHPVARERFLELGEHRRAVVLVRHVDEVEDDDPAEVAQAQLARDHLRRFQVGLEDRVVEVAQADEPAGVDVDRRHRLGLVDDEVAAALQLDAARERLLDLLLDVVQIEQRPLARVVLDLRQDLRHVVGGERLQAHEVLARIDHDAGGVLVDEVAQHALREHQVFVQQRRRVRGLRALADVAPQPARVRDVVRELGVGRALRDGADDVAAALVGREQVLQLLPQELAAALVLDALGDADVRVLREIHEEPPGDRDLRREAGALAPDRVLDHLHHDRLTLGENPLDRARGRGRFAVLALLPDVGDVQERGALEPDLDERRLHPGQHPHHAPHVDVADDAAARGALDVQLLHHAVRHHRDAGFLRRDVDQDLFGHGG